MKKLFLDERTERINGSVSFYILMLTQIALVGAIVYKRYFLGLPSKDYAEISWIVWLSMGLYWATRLYVSGILPVITLKKMLGIYLILVAAIAIPTALIVGLPAPERWYEVLFPFIGVAVVMGVISLVAYLGKRRLDKEISND